MAKAKTARKGMNANGLRKPRRVLKSAELAIRNPVWMSQKKGPMTAEQSAQLVVEARMAFHRITTGCPDDDDPDGLAVVVNVGMVLCEWDEAGSAAYLPLALDARDALQRAHLRANDGTGKAFNFDGPGMESWRQLLELHEQFLEAAGHETIMRALVEVALRIRKGQAINLQPMTQG